MIQDYMLLLLIMLASAAYALRSLPSKIKLMHSKKFMGGDDFENNQVPFNHKQGLSATVSKVLKVVPLIPLFASFRVLSESNIDIEELPYGYSALEPFISERTLKFHHDKHYAKYVTTTKSMIQGTSDEKNTIESIIRLSFSKNQGLFNNAAQAWNHAFYWKCMKPGGGGIPSGKLAGAIDKSFGSYANFKKEFAMAANSVFGSGWAWLVKERDGRLSIVKTSGADNPLTTPNVTPLLTIDVWEHAYYLDYQNMRATYVDTFMDKLVDWSFVESKLG